MLRQSGDFAWRGASPAPGLIQPVKAAIMASVSENAGGLKRGEAEAGRMSHSKRRDRPTIGVLAGWQYYWTATPLSYLNPIYRGIRQAAADLDCNLLLGCGMGASATSSDPLCPAWPFPSSDSDFVPIGPWNTDGLIVINPLHTKARSADLQAVIAAGHPVTFVAAGEEGVTIAADNAAGRRTSRGLRPAYFQRRSRGNAANPGNRRAVHGRPGQQ